MNSLERIKHLNEIFSEKEIASITEEEAYQLILDIKKLAYGEQGDQTIEFFNNSLLFTSLIYLGDKYQSNEKLLAELVSVIGVQVRFKDHHDMENSNYHFLFKHKYHKSKKIQFLVASYLYEYPNFQDEWEGKWDYILHLPNLAPKKHSKDFFIWAMYRNKENIPNVFKDKFLNKMEQILNKGYFISENTQVKCDEILNNLKTK